ncbi:MAG: hypothetical protein QXK80_02130 [Candidatus Pacearchaeota archaeon]
MKQQYYNQGICVECGEGIFNPLCHECITKEVTTWLKLRKQSKLKRKIMNKLSKWIKEYEDIEGQRCIACQKKTNIMCPYCFTEKIYFELKKELKFNIKNKLLKEFLIFFNYDFDKTGYGKEKIQ